MYGRSLGLFPAMVCRNQSGLRALTEQFCVRTTIKRAGKELVFLHDWPSPRVELPYAYLMMWFALHCLVLIQPGKKPPEDERHAYLRCFENSQWVGQYLVEVRRMVSLQDLYILFHCFPHIPDTEFDENFRTMGTVRLLLGWAPSSGWSASDILTWCTEVATTAILSFIFPAALPDSSIMTKCTLGIQTLGSGGGELD